MYYPNAVRLHNPELPMKTVHIVAVALLIGAIALAFYGQAKASIGLLGLSTLIEIIGAAITGKSRNT
ncbi:hypothetical protein ABIE32_002469 [Comamonas sp. 4034]